jgi:predicted DNA-binding protein (UPF0251 family)
LKRKKRPSVSLERHTGEAGIDPDDPSEYVKPGAALERSEDERQLSGAIARLSPEHREVLLLKDIEGLKYEDIAEVLAVPIGTIRSRLHRARLELRDLLVPLEERGTDEQPVPDELRQPGDSDGGPDDPDETQTKTPAAPRKGLDALENGEPPTQLRRTRRAD